MSGNRRKKGTKSNDPVEWKVTKIHATDTFAAEVGKVVAEPIPMLLHCPLCNERHVDAGEFATRSHHTHACQACGHVWRPALVPTVGVRFLPGFKDA